MELIGMYKGMSRGAGGGEGRIVGRVYDEDHLRLSTTKVIY